MVRVFSVLTMLAFTSTTHPQVFEVFNPPARVPGDEPVEAPQNDMIALSWFLELGASLPWNVPRLLCTVAAEEYQSGAVSCATQNLPPPDICGWQVRAIELRGCHSATLVTSPDRQRHYYMDTLVSMYGVRMEEEAAGDSWVPATAREKRQFAFIQNYCSYNPFGSSLLYLTDPVYADDVDSVRYRLQPDSGSAIGGREFDEEVGENCAVCANFSSSRPPLDDPFEGESSLTCPLPTPGPTLPVRPVRAIDPNEKSGSPGIGSLGFVAGDEPLRYTILFENVSSATAPAQEVVIEDKLDLAAVDLGTFSLGPISFADELYIPPPGTSTLTTDINLTDEPELVVRVTVDLDRTNGFLRWHLRSVNPDTGELPDDPLAGFLPPNLAPPEGEGSVSFVIKPRDELPTDAAVRNTASIVFDSNEPIETAEWLNTIDRNSPNSAVFALSEIQSSEYFTVEWDGEDDGAGIESFTIFVSVNGNPPTAWIRNSEKFSAVYEGEDGHSYAFYSTARDLVGNVEDIPIVPDAITRVAVVGGSPGDFNGDGCVDRADYGTLMGDIRDGPPSLAEHDLNGDGAVNRADARTMIGLFTNPRGAACVQ